MTISRNIVGNLFLVFGSLCIGFLLAEITVRVFFPEPTQFVWSNKHLFAAGEPNKEWIAHSAEFGDVRMRTNSQGFRGPEFPGPKQPGVPRILFIGDSFIAANQMNEEDRFQDILANRFGGDVEIVSIGMNASDPIEALQNYRVLGKPLHPDIVVHELYSANDLTAADSPRFALTGSGVQRRVERIIVGSGGVALKEDFSLRHSQFVRLTWRFVYQVLRPLQLRVRYWIWNADSDKGKNMVRRAMGAIGWHTTFGLEELEKANVWETTMAIERTFREEVEGDNGRFVVMLVPSAFVIHGDWREEVKGRFAGLLQEEQWDIDGMDNRLEHELAANGFRFIPMRQPLRREAAVGTYLYFKSDGHFNQQGHEKVADILLQPLWEEIRAWCSRQPNRLEARICQ